MKKLDTMGEYEIVRWIRAQVPSSECMAIPVGSDSAALRVPDGTDLLVNTDGVPYSLLQRDTPEDGRYVGRFTVIHTLSDIICMGGKPVAFLSNLHMTRDTPFNYLEALFQEMQQTLSSYDACTIGGDIKESDFRSVVGVGLGFVEKGRALTRSNARVGDLLAITLCEGRPLGTRWAHEVVEHLGLPVSKEMLEELKTARFDNLRLPYREMRAAFQTGWLGAAMDTSDGVLACLKFMAEMSRVGFLLYEHEVLNIIDPRVIPLADQLAISPIKFAFNAGFDWETVCTVDRSGVNLAQAAVESSGGVLAVIGEVVPASAGIHLQTVDGKVRPIRIFADEKFLPTERKDPVRTWLAAELFG